MTAFTAFHHPFFTWKSRALGKKLMKQDAVFWLCLFVCLFLAIPTACGNSWARKGPGMGQELNLHHICHSNRGSDNAGSLTSCVSHRGTLRCWGFLFCFIFVFFPFRATPVAYGSSQTKGWIWAIAGAYTTARTTPDPSQILDLHCNLWQHQILSPLSKAKDQTFILRDTSQVLNLLSHNGTS